MIKLLSPLLLLTIILIRNASATPSVCKQVEAELLESQSYLELTQTQIDRIVEKCEAVYA